MSLGLSRALLRRQFLRTDRQLFNRRAASSATEAAGSAASKAQQTASIAASKASDGLSRVTSSAGNALGAAGKALGGIGGPTGRLIGAIQGVVPPTIYYSRVALEMGKIVFEARKMNPPSLQTFQSYWNIALSYLRNPSAISSAASSAPPPATLLAHVRNVDRQQLAAAGIIAAELLGFFTIGEMLGRFKIVGYRSSTVAHD